MKEGDERFADLLRRVNVGEGMHCCLHVSMRNARRAFPGLRAESMIRELQRSVGTSGSLLVPTFSFSWKKITGVSHAYDSATTPSAVGSFSEAFRNEPGIIRTSAPTHSFGLWGKAVAEISAKNAPESPLGAGSPLEWLDTQSSASLLLLGTDFTSVSYIHYLETLALIRGMDVFPWPEYEIEAVGMGINGEQKLTHVPGCSKSFSRLEKQMEGDGRIRWTVESGLRVLSIALKDFKRDALPVIQSDPAVLLCPAGTCAACDHRHPTQPLDHSIKQSVR
jgi:aminoglycoside N3'-acetyltransferase